ncbi:MAG: MFS transporter, partial [Clostridiales bacterium]|nr:MFS transporter [Clostridiales bacterium]
MSGVKLSRNIKFNLILFGFIGQVAWSMENIYFNTFLFNYIGGSTKDISRMVALSAATAVLATFLMGTLSDKLGKRKAFMSLGYIVWGFTVAVFAFISRDNIGRIFGLAPAAVLSATVSVVIIMDCVMTFVGS